MKRIALAASAALLLLAAAALAGVARPESAHAVDAQPAAADTVTVSGTGSVSATPSTAVFSFGVDTRAATAKAALAENARDMRAVIAALKAAGARDVTTRSVSVSQSFDQNGQPNGFDASNTVTARSGIDRSGAIIDAAVSVGANRVDGPSVSADDQATLYRTALKAAMADARLRAETLASAAARGLGAVTAITESGSETPMPLADKMAATDGGAPVEAGTQAITAGVTVTYALR